MDEERQRVVPMQKGLLIGVAAVGDSLQFLLGWIPFGFGWVINMIISFLLTVVFLIWFRVLGIPLFSSHKRLVAKWFAVLAEILPLPLSMFPMWTAVTWYSVHHIQKEDDEHNEKVREENAPQQRRTANDNGRRGRGAPRNLSRAA